MADGGWQTDGERWTEDGGRRPVDNGQRMADSGRQRTPDDGQRSAAGRRRTTVGGQRTADSGRRTAHGQLEGFAMEIWAPKKGGNPAMPLPRHLEKCFQAAAARLGIFLQKTTAEEVPTGWRHLARGFRPGLSRCRL